MYIYILYIVPKKIFSSNYIINTQCGLPAVVKVGRYGGDRALLLILSIIKHHL